MVKYCVACGYELEPEDNYCINCGEPVASNAPSPCATSVPAVAFECLPNAKGGRSDAVDGGAGSASTMVWQPGVAPSPLDAVERENSVSNPLADEDDYEPTMVVNRFNYCLMRESGGEESKLSLPCVVGRGSAADVCLKGNRAISRIHAKFYEDEGSVWVENLSTTNCTYVEGEPLSEGEALKVEDGTVLDMGDEKFVFKVKRSH